MDKLKPCPFCGKSVANVGTVAEHELADEYLPEYGWSTTHYDVVCSALLGGCGASTGKNNETAEKAIEVWNRRADNAESIDGRQN